MPILVEVTVPAYFSDCFCPETERTNGPLLTVVGLPRDTNLRITARTTASGKEDKRCKDMYFQFENMQLSSGCRIHTNYGASFTARPEGISDIGPTVARQLTLNHYGYTAAYGDHHLYDLSVDGNSDYDDDSDYLDDDDDFASPYGYDNPGFAREDRSLVLERPTLYDPNIDLAFSSDTKFQDKDSLFAPKFQRTRAPLTFSNFDLMPGMVDPYGMVPYYGRVPSAEDTTLDFRNRVYAVVDRRNLVTDGSSVFLLVPDAFVKKDFLAKNVYAINYISSLSDDEARSTVARRAAIAQINQSVNTPRWFLLSSRRVVSAKFYRNNYKMFKPYLAGSTLNSNPWLHSYMRSASNLYCLVHHHIGHRPLTCDPFCFLSNKNRPFPTYRDGLVFMVFGASGCRFRLVCRRGLVHTLEIPPARMYWNYLRTESEHTVKGSTKLKLGLQNMRGNGDDYINYLLANSTMTYKCHDAANKPILSYKRTELRTEAVSSMIKIIRRLIEDLDAVFVESDSTAIIHAHRLAEEKKESVVFFEQSARNLLV